MTSEKRVEQVRGEYVKKTVFTTGEVAKLCNVAPRTVSKWFDEGHLRGYRIPGSKDRRIPIDQLIRFMQAHGIPLNGLDTGAIRVLIADADSQFCQVLKRSLSEYEAYNVHTADSIFEAGALANELRPHVLVVDVNMLGSQPEALIRSVRSLNTPHEIRLIATGTNLSMVQGQSLLQAGFDGYLAKPFDLLTLLQLVESKAAASASV